MSAVAERERAQSRGSSSRLHLPSGLRPSSGSVVGALIVVAAVWLYASAAGFSTTTAPAAAPPVPSVPLRLLPPSLGRFELAWKITGDEALTQIDQLHLGRFPLESAEVAGYGSGVTAWVAVPGSATSAAVLVDEMRTAIARGGSPFSTPVRVPGPPGMWRTEGNGQVHVFFASGGALWWLAADPSSAESALAALREQISTG